MLQTRSDALRVWVVNSGASAGGSAVVVTNTPLPVIINNSGGLYAMQSGTWTVNVANTGGSVVVSNTQTAINIINSAGWVVNVANTANIRVIVLNTGGTLASQTIANTAGWVMSQANTFGMVVFVMDSGAVASAVTAVASTVGAVTLATAKNNRVALSIYNASANPLFMKLGASASTASYTLMMVASGYYEMARPIYEGIVTGIWQTANGQALITETT